MKAVWTLQDAKNRFSELVDRALQEGPQTITRRGSETAVLLSIDAFRDLTQSRGSLVGFLQNSPLADVDLDLERHRDYGREIDL